MVKRGAIMAKRKPVKKKAKKAKKTKSLKQHAKELHTLGKHYVKRTTKAVSLHDKKRQERIKKQLKRLEKAIKELVKLESR